MRDEIQSRILTRTYFPGDKLPKDEELAEELGCSRSTVQRAMQDLADAGLVERRRKGGTRVRPNPITRATLDIPLIRHEVEARGGTYSYQLLHQETKTTPPHIAARFSLNHPQDFLHIEALHYSDHQPYVLESRWVCLETVPEMREVDLSKTSANEWLVQNKPYSRCDLKFYAIEANTLTAAHFNTAPGAALLVIDRTTWIDTAPITTVQVITKPGYQLLTQI